MNHSCFGVDPSLLRRLQLLVQHAAGLSSLASCQGPVRGFLILFWFRGPRAPRQRRTSVRPTGRTTAGLAAGRLQTGLWCCRPRTVAHHHHLLLKSGRWP